MHQKVRLRGQTMGMYGKPQKPRHRQNSAEHAKEVQEQTPRKPRLLPLRLNRDVHLLWILPIRMDTTRLGQDTKPFRPGRLASSLNFSQSNLPECVHVHFP